MTAQHISSESLPSASRICRVDDQAVNESGWVCVPAGSTDLRSWLATYGTPDRAATDHLGAHMVGARRPETEVIA
jgi:hypothetical protein